MITPPVTLITHGIVAVAAAAAFGAGWYIQENRYEAVLAKRAADHASGVAAAAEHALVETGRLQKAKDEAEHMAAVRQSALARDLARTRAAADGLRSDLSAARAAMPDASCTSLRLHATTLNAVFGECSVEVEGLAGQAGGHAIDALKLLESWPAAIESRP